LGENRTSLTPTCEVGSATAVKAVGFLACSVNAAVDYAIAAHHFDVV